MTHCALWLILLHLTASSAQSPRVRLAEVPQLEYPSAARIVGVSGEVIVHVQVRPDGTVASAKAVSSPAMLQQAAVDSARQALFVCRDCTEPLTTYALSYSFHLTPNPDCLDCISKQPTVVTFTDEQVTVQAPRDCQLNCDPALVRSARCLWLWRCGVSDGCRKLAEWRKKRCEAMGLLP